MADNYVLTHLHSQYSLLDSVTPFESYVDWAVEHGQTAIASTEHGVIYNWTNKKAYCDSKGIKYIHGVELYLTAQLYHPRTKVISSNGRFERESVKQKYRDNYHIVLLAKNLQGVMEINQLVSIANDADHFYFKPRITFEEMLNISDNVIICSACMKSPLWSYKYVIQQYESDIEGLNIDISNLQARLNNLQLERDGVTTIRKKKRKPEVIASEIEEVDNEIRCNQRNIELINNDIDYLNNIIGSLLQKYTYLEVQPHVNSEDQKVFNKQLADWSTQYNIPLICGTDTHSLNKYLAECRTILQTAKRIEFDNEDEFDLTVKTYDELYQMFKDQGALTDEQIKEALNNTNVLADNVEDFELDKSFKYPIFKSPEEDALMFRQKCRDGFNDKLKSGAIKHEQKQEYIDRVNTELTALEQVGMMGFMLSMSEFIGKLRSQGIPFGPARGSAGGSLVAYLTDITDCDPIVWGLSFERFCNKDRVSLGDVDVDISDLDEQYIIQNIIDTIGADKVAHVFALGTNQSLGAIDDIGRALSIIWVKENGKSTKELKAQKRELQRTAMDKEEKKKAIDTIQNEIKKIDDYNAKLNNPWSLSTVARIKKEWQIDKQQCEQKYPELFYYYKGMKDVTISASMHPAGIIVSPITLADNYGIMYNEGKAVLQLDMDAAHDVNLVKYDILKLKSVKVLNQICKYLHVPYPKCYEVDWDDQNVWADIAEDNLTIPQYESNFAGQLINTMKPVNITELAIINAAIRPAGTSYRDKLTQRISNKTSNPDVDKFLEETYSYCVFQEQIMGFLQKFCGYSGSEADTIRRIISDKNHAKLDAMTPDILNRYIERRMSQGVSQKQSEDEANEYFKVIHDAGSYAFNKSHAVAYSLLGYMFGYMRYYHFPEYICAFLNYADNEGDIINGTKLATSRGYKIEEPKFRYGSSLYSYDEENKLIYKGMGSIKYLNDTVADQLYALRNNQYNNFFEVLADLATKTSLNSRQLQILIKLDFFSEFGNSRALLEYVNWFTKFRAKSSSELFLRSVPNTGAFPEIVYKIIERHSKKTNTRYMLSDVPSILNEIHEVIQSVGYKDFPMKEKILTQKEYLGYISIKTGVEADRPTCLITSMQPLIARKGKSAGKVWARVFKTHSIGSGKNSELWINERDYQNQYHFDVDDIITIDYKKMKCEEYQGKKQWWITNYVLYVDS